MFPLSVALAVGTKELWEELQPSLAEVRVLFEQAEIPDARTFAEKIARTSPDVVLLDLAVIRPPLLEVISVLRSMPLRPAIFALHKSQDADLILAAFRAGIDEYLAPPLGGQLQAAFQKLATSKERAANEAPSGSKIVGFVSAKGGCGATTIACHVAAEIAAVTRNRTLLADLDLSSGIVSFLLKSKSAYSVADAANNLQRLDASYWRAVVSNGIPGLEVIGAPSTPASRSVDAISLRHVIKFAQSQYDWIIVDLGRGVDKLLLTMLEVVHETHIVTTMDIPALHQAKSIVQVLRDTGYLLDKLRLVINRTPKRSDVTEADLESVLGISVVASMQEESETLNEAYADGRLVAGGTGLGRQYARLARKIAGVTEQPKKKFSLFS